MTTLEKIGAIVGIGGGAVGIVAGLFKCIAWVWSLIKASLRKELEEEILELKIEVKNLKDGQEKLKEKHADIVQDLLKYLQIK